MVECFKELVNSFVFTLHWSWRCEFFRRRTWVCARLGVIKVLAVLCQSKIWQMTCKEIEINSKVIYKTISRRKLYAKIYCLKLTVLQFVSFLTISLSPTVPSHVLIFLVEEVALLFHAVQPKVGL